MKWKSKIIEQLTEGPLIRVEFFNANGDSASAPVGRAIGDILDQYSPSALILDFSKSEYEVGDGILGIIRTHGKLPACVVASGPSREHVERALSIAQLIEIYGGRIFETELEAAEYLISKLKCSG